MSIQTKVDLSKEDFVLTKMHIADVSYLDRSNVEGKQSLTFVKFVGSRSYGVSPNFLYFGEDSIDTLRQLRADRKMVDVLLKANDKGFNVVHIQLTDKI